MEDKEKTAIQKTLLDLIEDLDPGHIAPFLFQHGFLSKFRYEELTESNLPRYKLCQKFLNIITSESSCCTFDGFLSALRYNNVYTFLAVKLEEQLKKVHEHRRQNGTIIYDRRVSQGQTESHDQIPSNENPSVDESRDERSRDKRSRDGESQETACLFKPIKKIDVFKKSRQRMSELAHKLKRLSHDGNMNKFREMVSRIERIYNKNKLDSVKDIKERMEYADMRFTALEAEASSRRVQYDVTLYGNPLFSDMESVIPYTTNPRVSSMTYLARYGSAVSMLESLDNGLAILQYSKHHAEHVVPCKETGMVYYIEVNLLSQKYEKEPSTDLKMEILKTAELAISQFSGEDEAVQRDYQRMLMLKMVFCRLGIGLFGNRIKNIVPDDTDRDAAKDYLDFIEKPQVWDGMEKRRKMLFQVAKSELYQQRSQYELALPHAKEAARIAEENNWSAELPNLIKRLQDVEQKKLNPPQRSVEEEPDSLEDWLQNFEDDDSAEMEELKFGVNEMNEGANFQPEMEVLKPPNGQSYGQNDLLEIMRLKSLSCFQVTTDEHFPGSSTLTESADVQSRIPNPLKQPREPVEHAELSDLRSVSTHIANINNRLSNRQLNSMNLLKQPMESVVHTELNDLKSVKMDTLKHFTGIQETGCTTGTLSLSSDPLHSTGTPVMEVLKLVQQQGGTDHFTLNGLESFESNSEIPVGVESEQRLHELNFANPSSGASEPGALIDMSEHSELLSIPVDVTSTVRSAGASTNGSTNGEVIYRRY